MKKYTFKIREYYNEIEYISFKTYFAKTLELAENKCWFDHQQFTVQFMVKFKRSKYASGDYMINISINLLKFHTDYFVNQRIGKKQIAATKKSDLSKFGRIKIL